MILKQIDKITIPATKGNKLIKDHKGSFSYVDSGFDTFTTTTVGDKKPKTKLAVMELQKDATFEQMLEGYDLEKCVMTQDQVIEVLINHQDKLNNKWRNFFLIKNNGKFFVARAGFGGAGRLRVRVYELADSYVWYAECTHLFLIPQQALTPSSINPQTPSPLDTSDERLEKLELAFYRQGVMGVDRIMKTVKEVLCQQ